MVHMHWQLSTSPVFQFFTTTYCSMLAARWKTQSIKLICMHKAPEPTKKDRLSILLRTFRFILRTFVIVHNLLKLDSLFFCTVYFVSHGTVWLEFWALVPAVYLDCSQCLVLTNNGADILNTHLCSKIFPPGRRLDPTFALSKALILRLKMYTC